MGLREAAALQKGVKVAELTDAQLKKFYEEACYQAYMHKKTMWKGLLSDEAKRRGLWDHQKHMPKFA